MQVFLIVIDDDAYSSDSVPAVAFVDVEKFEGNVTIDSSADAAADDDDDDDDDD